MVLDGAIAGDADCANSGVAPTANIAAAAVTLNALASKVHVFRTSLLLNHRRFECRPFVFAVVEE
ncbi:hypothetical protein [Sphingopyxis sp. LK2115]|jgi:hypothetical protein|uniref:hypothetical protein n=1 Tax=Sphingopyxis sp. LK2115 TaxID=2744558 RepID=UPI001CB73086|nr:hypothetical protein [Sphingopyxis sp. LK2115]